eukprot:798475-Amphidinium_carterae.1
MSFVTAPMNVCDLCAIMPFYLNLAISRLSSALSFSGTLSFQGNVLVAQVVCCNDNDSLH